MKPLYDAVLRYSKSKITPFHMPGHKQGKGFVPQDLFMNPAIFDLTELWDTDDLHYPKGPIGEAQVLAAKAFGAKRTWFLVNGSTCGIQAMILAHGQPGQKMIVVRDFHYAAFHAMAMTGIRPVYVYPKRDPVSGRFLPVSAAAVNEAIVQNPDAAAVYITRPGYYGDVCDIERIVVAAHKNKMPVLVDEAHGAHLSFSEKLPISAMAAGADFCIQSAHKTLPAFTQGAYAHMSEAVQGEPERIERFETALRIVQTASPSFLLMSSLDYAREFMSERGKEELERVLVQIDVLYRNAAEYGYGVPADIPASRTVIPASRSMVYIKTNADKIEINRASIDIASQETSAHSKITAEADRQQYGRDMTRIVLDTAQIGLTGIEMEQKLAQKYNIRIEMSDLNHIVLIATIADRNEDFLALDSALYKIAQEQRSCCLIAEQSKKNNAHTFRDVNVVGDERIFDGVRNIQHVQTDRDDLDTEDVAAPFEKIDLDIVIHHRRVSCRLRDAIGCQAGTMITPYPPGIPLLCPGERITAKTVHLMEQFLLAGAKVNGIETTDPQMITVLDECAGKSKF